MVATLTGDDEPEETRGSADAVSDSTLVEAGLLGMNRQPAD